MKPFLKWAGGKSRLLGKIGERLPHVGGRLIEPFVGSGAVFLGLERDYAGYVLGDVNRDLISLYGILSNEGSQSFVDDCERLFTSENNSVEAFMELRREFNEADEGSARRGHLFVYLNRHCFNGLCRYNGKGGYNVPYGKTENPHFPRKELEGFAAKATKAEFIHGDFRTVMQLARPGDVVYCDPPYLPLPGKSSFATYAAGGFSMKDQEDMAELSRDCASRGIPVLISNHDTEDARRLYEGATINTLDVKRSISADGGKRLKAKEILALFTSDANCSSTTHYFPPTENQKYPLNSFDQSHSNASMATEQPGIQIVMSTTMAFDVLKKAFADASSTKQSLDADLSAKKANAAAILVAQDRIKANRVRIEEELNRLAKQDSDLALEEESLIKQNEILILECEVINANRQKAITHGTEMAIRLNEELGPLLANFLIVPSNGGKDTPAPESSRELKLDPISEVTDTLISGLSCPVEVENILASLTLIGAEDIINIEIPETSRAHSEGMAPVVQEPQTRAERFAKLIAAISMCGTDATIQNIMIAHGEDPSDEKLITNMRSRLSYYVKLQKLYVLKGNGRKISYSCTAPVEEPENTVASQELDLQQELSATQELDIIQEIPVSAKEEVVLYAQAA